MCNPSADFGGHGVGNGRETPLNRGSALSTICKHALLPSQWIGMCIYLRDTADFKRYEDQLPWYCMSR